MISLANVLTIWRKEMLDALRDKRTIYGMIVIPIVIYPVMLVLFSQVLMSQTQRLKEKKYGIHIVGAKRAPELVERFEKDGSWAVELDDEAKDAPEASDARLLAGDIQVVMVVPPEFEAAIRDGMSAPVGLRFNQAKDESMFAHQRASTIVEDYSAEVLKRRLVGKPEGFERPVVVTSKGVAPKETAAGFQLGRLLAMLLVLMTAVSSFYPAIDMASGEKERGTMETLLVSPALRSEIVLGKYFAVSTISLATAILHVASMGLTFSHFFKSMVGPGLPGLSFSINPMSAILVLLPMIPLTLLFSALCLGLSAFARSYKEAMVYLTPVMIVANISAFMALIPGLEFNYALALVPVQNCAALTVALLSGDWKWGHVFATFGASSVYAFVALRWTWSIFQREDVLLRGGAEFDWKHWLRTFGTARPGIAHALVAFIAMMALQLAIGPSFANMAPHRQLLSSQFLLVALPAVLIALLGSLHFRSTFRFRMPRISHVALAPVIAISGFVLATALGYLLLKIPFFNRGMEHAAQRQHMIDALGGLPVRIFFVALLPAVCEEFLFRGLVLSGLKRDLGKWTGILMCGALFGVAHQVPLAIAIVGCLGILLCWMALKSGTILVTVVAHFTWNTCALLSESPRIQKLLGGNSSLPPVLMIVGAAVVFVGAVFVFARINGNEDDEPAGGDTFAG